MLPAVLLRLSRLPVVCMRTYLSTVFWRYGRVQLKAAAAVDTTEAALRRVLGNILRVD